MDVRLRIVLSIVVLIYQIIILFFIRKKKITIKYSFIWSFSGLIMIIAVAFPRLVNYISEFLGFKSLINMMFLIGFFLLLFITFSITIIISSQSRKIRLITQELSILKSKESKK